MVKPDLGLWTAITKSKKVKRFFYIERVLEEEKEPKAEK